MRIGLMTGARREPVTLTETVQQAVKAGATEFMASIRPVGEDAEGSIARTKSLLGSFVGKL